MEVYLLYKLHLAEFPRSLRPSFPKAFLDFDFPLKTKMIIEKGEYFRRLKDRIEHFFETFFKICGVELLMFQEFHEFLNPKIEVKIVIQLFNYYFII